MSSQFLPNFAHSCGLDDVHFPRAGSSPIHPPTPRSLEVRNLSKKVVDSLTKSLGDTSLPTKTAARILAGRGFTADHDIASCVSPDVSHLPNPSRLKHFDAALNVIVSVCRAKQRIGIVGDYDVDGVTAVAQAVSTFKEADVPHDFWIPNRFRDGYGISDRIVNEILEKQCSLVILFDHGTHSHKQIAQLRERGVEVIVFDHHIAGAILPDCILVNPRQPNCGMASEFPCASGLSYLLQREVRRSLGLAAADCSLAGLATVADMVPLIGLNRTLSRLGLHDTRGRANLGLTALARELALSPQDIISSDLSFLLGPAINAAGRLDDASMCVELLTTNDRERANVIARVLKDLNAERKDLQRNGVLSNLEMLATHRSLSNVIISYSDAHHPGVNGLVAQAVATRYTRPAFVFSKNQDDTLTGSARNGHESYDLDRILTVARERDSRGVIVRAGGHKAAGGVTIRADCLAEFESLLEGVVAELHPEPPQSVSVEADAKARLRSITPEFISLVDRALEPYGNGFSAPQFLFEDLRVTAVEALSGGRFMVTLEQGNKRSRAFIGPELWNGDLCEGAVVSVIATPAAVYRDRQNHVQLSVSAYQVTSAAPVGSSQDEHLQQPQCVQGTINLIVDEDSSLDENSLTLSETPVASDDTPSSPERKTERKSKRFGRAEFLGALEALRRAELDFDSRYIYPELKQREEDFFNPIQPEERNAWWAELSERYNLQIRYNTLEYRPSAIEFIRYFLESNANKILQAPTGSGKTEIALTAASPYRAKGHRVIFLAPTIDIVRQQSDRVQRLLGETPVLLDGGATPPETRREIFSSAPGFIVATPHVIENDLVSGVFRFLPTDLVIIDEAHHATGDYPYVSIIKAAREKHSRILALTATPSQILPGGRWDKLDDLKKLVGVASIFPLNYPTHRPKLDLRSFSQPESILAAENQLSTLMANLQNTILNNLIERGEEALLREARRAFRAGAAGTGFPTTYQLRNVRDGIIGLSDGQKWELYTCIRAMGELSELHHCLRQQGIAMFLLRCISKRFEALYPPRCRAGTKVLAAPKYLVQVYTSPQVTHAYNALAHGYAREFLRRDGFRAAIERAPHEWALLSSKNRVSLFNQVVSDVKARVIDSLAETDYSDSPETDYILEELRRNSRRSFISVRDRDHAIFLAKFLDAKLKDTGLRAVSLTGRGSATKKGLSRSDREHNLRAFNQGAASIIVGTSASNEGVDLVADVGFCLDFDSSQTSARQKEGRVGRRTFGEFKYLCMTWRDREKVMNIIQKNIAFQTMLNTERASIMSETVLAIPKEGQFPSKPIQKLLDLD